MCESWVVIPCILAIIVAIVLIAVSFAQLDANDQGLDYNKNTQQIDVSTIYNNGVHFIGVGHKLIKFTKQIVDLDMQSDVVHARTRDGLDITLGTRINYRLTTDPVGLGVLYMAFGADFESPIYYQSRHVICNVASQYSAFEFWSNREQISAAMATALQPMLGDLYCSLDTFTLVNFNLPIDFQNAIIQTDVQAQNLAQVTYQQTSAETNRDTAIQAADQQVIAIGNQAQADAEAYLLSVDAIVQNMEWAAAAELESYPLLKSMLNLTNDELNQFLWLDTVNYWARESKQRYSIVSPSSLSF